MNNLMVAFTATRPEDIEKMIDALNGTFDFGTIKMSWDLTEGHSREYFRRKFSYESSPDDFFVCEDGRIMMLKLGII